ncbi:MAG: DUF4062 domain-containing protein, partial [Burkholderiales bacterium]
MSAVASQKHGPEVLLIFLGHSSDADTLADAIYGLERDLQRLLDQHLSVSAEIPFKSVRIWEWRKDGLPVVGGQDQVVAEAIKRANIAVFVFKERIGTVSWDELNQSRNRENPPIPVLAFFPTDSPPDLNDAGRIAKWLDLVTKRDELVKDWNAPNSKALRPMEKYKDAAHLTTLAVEQLSNAVVSLLKCEPANKDTIPPEVLPAKFLGDHSHLSYDRQPVLTRSLDELDHDSLKELLAKPLSQDLNADLKKGRDGSNPAVSEQLENLGCLYAGRPTLGALLCFAPAQLLTDKSGCCTLQMAIHDGSERGGERAPLSLARGNLLLLYKKGMSWLTGGSVLRRRGQIGTDTRDDLEIPEIVLREALANALVHRDYESKVLQDQPTRIDVYPDKVEIPSYGLLLKEVPIELLNSPNQSLRPFRRNPVIAGIFQCMTLAELNASGIQRMRRVMTSGGLALPLFRTSDDFVCVTLARPFELSSVREPSRTTAGISRPTRKAFISSTSELVEHRKAAQDACLRAGVIPIMWEHSLTVGADIAAGLNELIDEADLCIFILGNRYGSISDRDGISFTEMEFNHAVERGLPVLAFTMHVDHPVTADSFERNPKQKERLTQFKRRVRDQRFCAEFKSPDDLRARIIEALVFLASSPSSMASVSAPNDSQVSHPQNPPAFYAERDYIGRNTFIGRAAQLQTLSDWAKPSDPTSVLLFEAIGGSGKSMLTWQWAKDEQGLYATTVRDWAGRFWYSFYEKGAIMRGFCQQALAYMTGQPLETFAKWPMVDLRKDLLAQLHQRPWLLILDGLERVLVAYHRFDASEVRDEEVHRPTDKILNRNPCDAIRDEDTDLIRALAAAAPSKILISSRLIPRVLLNQVGIPLPGVKPLLLPGLDEPDAEALLRSCGVQGTSADIRYYLTNYCANHPLVIGVLAGLINSPGPHRGDFDGWAADPDYGAKLNLASLDLIQSRNHILRAALDALEPASRQLLSTLALLSDAVDYDTVAAFNPHLPPEPEKVEVPTNPESELYSLNDHLVGFNELPKKEQTKLWRQYGAALIQRKTNEHAMNAWRDSATVREAPKKLAKTMQDLEHRGLLQYEGRTQRYDLHPVVRGVAVGSMKAEDKERYGQRVVDHYASLPHNPYEQAKTMEDVENGLQVVRTLLKLGHHQQAAASYLGDLARALSFNLEAHVETLSLLRPFFPSGWDALPKDVTASDASYLANSAAIALDFCGELQKAFGAYGAALRGNLETKNWRWANVGVLALTSNLSAQSLLTKALRVN